MAGLRTSFTVRSGVEAIVGGRAAWRFRPHYHAGDEIVRLLAGRARLRTAAGCREVSAGQNVVVAAGTVHRFEPVDAEGWAFSSEFVLRENAKSREAAADTDLTERAIELLKGREGLRTDTERIARVCGVSAGHLSRSFRRVTGTGLHNFHVVMVLQKAKDLLRVGAPLAATAFDSGFYDQAHLTREFVRTYGFTPNAFRTAWAGRA